MKQSTKDSGRNVQMKCTIEERKETKRQMTDGDAGGDGCVSNVNRNVNCTIAAVGQQANQRGGRRGEEGGGGIGGLDEGESRDEKRGRKGP